MSLPVESVVLLPSAAPVAFIASQVALTQALPLIQTMYNVEVTLIYRSLKVLRCFGLGGSCVHITFALRGGRGSKIALFVRTSYV